MSINSKHSFSTVYCGRYYELTKTPEKETKAPKKRTRTEVLFDKRKGIRKDTQHNRKPKQGFLWQKER